MVDVKDDFTPISNTFIAYLIYFPMTASSIYLGNTCTIIYLLGIYRNGLNTLARKDRNLS